MKSIIELLRNHLYRNRRLLMSLIIIVILSNAVMILDPMYYKSKFACGRIYDVSRGMKGCTYVHYYFYLNNKLYKGSESYSYFKKSYSIFELKSIQCVRIEYSTLSNNINRIYDSRLMESAD